MQSIKEEPAVYLQHMLTCTHLGHTLQPRWQSVYLACSGAGPALPYPEGVCWFLASPARIGIFAKWSCVLSCLCLTDVCTQWGSTNSFRMNKSVKKVYQLLPMEWNKASFGEDMFHRILRLHSGREDCSPVMGRLLTCHTPGNTAYAGVSHIWIPFHSSYM